MKDLLNGYRRKKYYQDVDIKQKEMGRIYSTLRGPYNISVGTPNSKICLGTKRSRSDDIKMDLK